MNYYDYLMYLVMVVQGGTALHFAAAFMHETIVLSLLKHGASVDIKNSTGVSENLLRLGPLPYNYCFYTSYGHQHFVLSVKRERLLYRF